MMRLLAMMRSLTEDPTGNALLGLATTGELRLTQPPPEMIDLVPDLIAGHDVFAVENVVHVFAVENGGPETPSFGAGAIPDLTLVWGVFAVENVFAVEYVFFDHMTRLGK